MRSDFRYWALIVLVGGDWGVESTKETIAWFRRDLAKRGPPMYFFNFSTFPLHKAVTWTTAVASVDELLEHVRRKVTEVQAKLGLQGLICAAFERERSRAIAFSKCLT